MNKYLLILCLLGSTLSLKAQDERTAIGIMLDAWHDAAAGANFEAYFGRMTEEGVFLGTDARENWQQAEFRSFSKPYFDKGKAWTFFPVERHIYLHPEGETAWFDELLDTRMGLCRGSGVVLKEKEGWKIAHYVLSIAVPNEQVDTLVSLKKEQDSLLTLKLKKAYPASRE